MIVMKPGDTPDWSHVSDNLSTLVRKKGPVKLCNLSAQYHALHGRSLDLGGKRVQACITKGILHGLLYDKTNKLLKLDGRKSGQKRSHASSDRENPVVAEVAHKRTKPSTTTGTPNWPQTSSDLQLLVKRRKRLRLGDVSGAYSAEFGRVLNLGGKGICARIKDGTLPGLQVNGVAKETYLSVKPTPSKRSIVDRKPAVTGVALKRSKPSTATSAPNWPQLSSDLQLLVKRRKRLRLGDISGAYSAEFGRVLNLGGKGVCARIKDGTLPGLQVNGVAKQKYLSVKPATSERSTKDTTTRRKSISGKKGSKPFNDSRAVGDKASGVAPTNVVAPATAASPIMTVRTSASAPSHNHALEDSIRYFLPTPSSAARPIDLPFILIDSKLSCTRALATLFRNGDSGATLEQLNNGDRVTMQLDGINLGSGAGEISYIKVWRDRFTTVCTTPMMAPA